MIFTNTKNTLPNIGIFEAETSFKQGGGSIFACLSLGILETLIRFIGHKDFSMTLKKKIDDDLNSLANTFKRDRVSIELLNAFKNLFKIVSEVPDPKTGFSLLRDNIGNEQIFKSFEMVMKSLIIFINQNKPDPYPQLDTVDTREVKYIILKTIAIHYGICIKFFQKECKMKDFYPETKEYYPILYIYNFRDTYKILYKKEAIDIEYGSADSNILKSPNLLSSKKINATEDSINASFKEHKFLSRQKEKLAPLNQRSCNIFSLNLKKESERASLDYINKSNLKGSRQLSETNLIQGSSKISKKYYEIEKDRNLRAFTTTFQDKIVPSPDNNSKFNPTSLKMFPIPENSYQEMLNLQLVHPFIDKSKPCIQKESNRNIFSINHIDFYVEVKNAEWNNKKIVIKRYKKLKNSDWRPENFFREIQILQFCSKLAESGHPFQRCYGAYLESLSLTILLESYESELKIRIEKLRYLGKQFTEQEVKIIVLRLLDGFCVLESLEIKHLNINPSTILINGSEEKIDVRIIDISASDSRLNRIPFGKNDQSMMSEMYKAPELFEKNENMRSFKKADVYSLGLVFLQLSDVNINIYGKNRKKYQNKLIDEIRYVRYDWLRNLLVKMLDNVETRINFKALKDKLILF